jgi:hypothetical protein
MLCIVRAQGGSELNAAQDVIDPLFGRRSAGAQLYCRSGFIGPEALLEDLVPFLDAAPQVLWHDCMRWLALRQCWVGWGWPAANESGFLVRVQQQ